MKQGDHSRFPPSMGGQHFRIRKSFRLRGGPPDFYALGFLIETSGAANDGHLLPLRAHDLYCRLTNRCTSTLQCVKLILFF